MDICLVKDGGCLVKDQGCTYVNTLSNVNSTPDIEKVKEDLLKELEKLSEDWKELKDWKEKIDDDLEDLHNIYYKASSFLLAVFKAGLDHVVFSEREKRNIVTSLLDVIKPIKICADYCFLTIHSRLEGYILRNRSAIEFLLELCKSSEQCKGSNEMLETLKYCADLLNRIIEETVDLVDSDKGPVDLEIYGASKVPKTHTWWQVNLIKLNKC